MGKKEKQKQVTKIVGWYTLLLLHSLGSYVNFSTVVRLSDVIERNVDPLAAAEVITCFLW